MLQLLFLKNNKFDVYFLIDQVHLCEAEDVHDYIRNGFPFQNKNKGEKTLVAVKMLRKDANKNAR